MKKLLGFLILAMLITQRVEAADSKLLEDFDHVFDVTWYLVEDLDEREPVEVAFREILTPARDVQSYDFLFKSQFTTIEERQHFTLTESNGTIIETDNQLDMIEIDRDLGVYRYGSFEEGIAYEYVFNNGEHLNIYDYGYTIDDLILHRYTPVYEFLMTHEGLFNTYQNDTHYILEVVTEDKIFGQGLDQLRTITTSDFIAESYKYGVLVTVDKDTGMIEDSILLTSVELPEQDASIVSELYANYSAFNVVNSLDNYSDEITRLMNETEGLSHFFAENIGHSRYLKQILHDIDSLKDSDVASEMLIREIPSLENYQFTLVTDLTFRALSDNQIESESEQILSGYIFESDDFLSVQAYIIVPDGEHLIRYGNTEQNVAWLNDSLSGGVFQDTNLYGVDEVIYFRYIEVLEQLKILEEFTVHESDMYYYLSSEGDAQLKEAFDALQYTYNDDFVEGSDHYGLLVIINKQTQVIQDIVFYRMMDTKDGEFVSYLEVLGGFVETTDFEPNLDLDDLD